MKQLSLFCALVFTAFSAEPITVSYIERPPYYYQENGVHKGLLLERTRSILRSAGLTGKFVSLPAKRILYELEQNLAPHISIGWFKKPEREQIGKFSLPIYQNKPQAVLVSKKRRALFDEFKTFHQLLDSPLKMGAIDGYSYGNYIDSLLNLRINAVDRAVVTSESNLLKLHAGRVDYLVVDQEERETMIQSAGLKLADFQLLLFPDIPRGNLRYLWCSRALPDSVMAKLNKAISRYADLK